MERNALMLAGVLMSVACTPGGPSDVDSVASGSETGTGDGESGESETSETSEPEPPPLPSMCGEPHHELVPVAQTTSWQTRPVSTTSSQGDYLCRSGLDPKFVVDGESLVIAYRNEWCFEPGPDGETFAPESQTIIGTDTAGVWMTHAAEGHYGAEYVLMEADGTVRVTTSANLYERIEGEWRGREPEHGVWAILADVNGGPDHALNVEYGVGYGRLTGDLAELSSLFQPFDEPYTTMSSMTKPDLVRSPSGVPHAAIITATYVPTSWDPVAQELRLTLSHPEQDGWVHENVQCWIGHLTGNSVPMVPDLEFDANGDAHLCMNVDHVPERGMDISYHTNVGGTWTEEIIGEGSSIHPCQLELDGQGRVHILTKYDYLVGEGGVWSTIWTFEHDAGASMEVSDDGTVYILRDGLALLTNASGQWEERIITGYLPP